MQKYVIYWCVTLLTLCFCLMGCTAEQRPTACDLARDSLRLGVLGANAYLIAYPDKADANAVAEIQGYVNDGYVCVEGLCADPNNPVFDACIARVLKRLDIIITEAGPITIPEQ